MSNPIIEDIAANLKTTIDGITTAAGYNQTLTSIRPRLIDFENASFVTNQVLIVQTTMEPDELSAEPSSTWYQHFDIVAYVLEEDATTDSIDTKANRIMADIVKALMVDPARGKTDGSVIDTKIHSAQMMQDDSGVSYGVILDISVHYRTKYEDPYTAI